MPSTRIEQARAAVAAAEEAHQARIRELHRLEERSAAYVSQPVPTDAAGRELRRQTLQQLQDEAAERQAARFVAQQALQAARESLAAAERELEQARYRVADLTTTSTTTEQFRARAQAEADNWQQRRDEALNQLPDAQAHLASLEPATS